MLLYFNKIDCLFFIFVYSLDKKAKAIMSTNTMSNNHVSFSVAREQLKEFFEKFIPSKRDYCINPECVKDTEAAVLHIWEAHSQAYEHIDRQAALNITTAWVNGKPHWIRSHYCCECFKKHVLVGENKNASQHYGNYCDGVQQVEVYFHNEPWPSTWFNCVTGEDHVLTEYQEMSWHTSR